MKNIQKILGFTVILMLLCTCEEVKLGNEFLNQQPEQIGYSIDSVFSSQIMSDRVLTYAYSVLNLFFMDHSPGRYNGAGRSTYDDITDLAQSFVTSGAKNVYYNGLLDPKNITVSSIVSFIYTYVESTSAVDDDGAYEAIRYCLLYLENIDRVPDISEELKMRRKAEAKIIMALHYYELLIHLGGVPWIDRLYKPAEIPDLKRETVESMVNKIVALLDEAAQDLPWKWETEADWGRYSKASAMALKINLLLFVASPIFNDDEPFHPEATLVHWYGDYDAARWQKVVTASEEFLSLLDANGGYAMAQAAGTTHKDYRAAYINGYHTRMAVDEALLMSSAHRNNKALEPYYGQTTEDINQVEDWYTNSSGVTMEYLDKVQMWPSGTEFPSGFNWSNPPFNPFFGAGGIPNRDPRMYETFVVNNDYWKGRKAELWRSGNGFAKGRDLRDNSYPSTIRMRKWCLEQDNATIWNKPVKIPVFRLPHIYLAYAEALNEANGGPNATAYEMVNKIRNRVGLANLPTGLSQEVFREAVLHERTMEFFYEFGITWHDIVRWKQDDRLQKRLHGLALYKTSAAPNFSYQVYELNSRFWWNNWDPKFYFTPIPQTEVDKGYGLIQNPGW